MMLNSHRGFSALWLVLGSRPAAPATLVLVVILLQILREDLRGPPNLALHLAMAAALVIRDDHLPSRAMGWRPVAMAEASDRTLERFFRRFRSRGPGAAKTGAL